MSDKILQIIPSPPNCADGVADYALLLATQMLKDSEIKTQFLVFRIDLEIKPTVISGFPLMRLPDHQPQSLYSSVPEDISAIILHFSGYPYFNTSVRGIFGRETPFWFPLALKSLVQNRKIKLIIMFHELPKLHWKQFFFFNLLNPIHTSVSRRLAKIADVIFTNNMYQQSLLSKWSGKNITKVLIFSNMGEPDTVPSLIDRQRRLIIFGGSARSRLYQKYFPVLIESCKLLGITEIYDIGPPVEIPECSDAEIKLVKMGFLSQPEISELLLTSIAGCLDYFRGTGGLGKSGVFSAYCAHGLVPILTKYDASEADEIYISQNYLVLGSQLGNLSPDQLQAVANKAHKWYRGHTLSKIARIFSSSIII
jgi:hypothetical protein